MQHTMYWRFTATFGSDAIAGESKLELLLLTRDDRSTSALAKMELAAQCVNSQQHFWLVHDIW